MPAKKKSAKKAVRVRDLKPSKDAKGGGGGRREGGIPKKHRL